VNGFGKVSSQFCNYQGHQSHLAAIPCYRSGQERLVLGFSMVLFKNTGGGQANQIDIDVFSGQGFSHFIDKLNPRERSFREKFGMISSSL